MRKNKKIKNDRLLEDDSFTLHKSNGNGMLRRQIWVDDSGEVTRYSLAYINHHLFYKDNGRVLGYDNAHGYHHRHYKGKITPIHFKSFAELEITFQQEFEALYEEAKNKK